MIQNELKRNPYTYKGGILYLHQPSPLFKNAKQNIMQQHKQQIQLQEKAQE